jgi:hypothetical protein
MPLIPGFSRRRGPFSDVDLRRHSFYASDSALSPTVIDGRASEQIPRRPSVSDFLVPAAPIAPGPSITRTSPDNGTELEERSASPPVQEETPKHQRFSMLKFRHASDSQLSTRARLQAQSPPPMPHRKMNPSPSPEILLTWIYSSRDYNNCTYYGFQWTTNYEEKVEGKAAWPDETFNRYPTRRNRDDNEE